MEDLAPGFRFYPTEEELLTFYLHHKLEGKREDLLRVMDCVIPSVDIYDYNPWDLPNLSWHKDPEQWFFFIPQQERQIHGGRANRLTASGYWKSTGSPGYVYSSTNRCMGIRKTMVFYKGRVPNGHRTEWKMIEYKAVQAVESSSSSSTVAQPKLIRQELSLCRVYKSSYSKRSFDRRPQEVEIDNVKDQQNHVENPSTMVERLSSGDQIWFNISQTGESSNTPIAMDNEIVWDLDRVDW